jgi:hypothetical protein
VKNLGIHTRSHPLLQLTSFPLRNSQPVNKTGLKIQPTTKYNNLMVQTTCSILIVAKNLREPPVGPSTAAAASVHRVDVVSPASVIVKCSN